MANSTHYSINEQGVQNNLLLRMIPLPVIKWVMTPEDQISMRSWILVILTASAIVGVIAAYLFYDIFYELIEERVWQLLIFVVLANFLFTGTFLFMVKIDSRRLLNIRDTRTGHNDETVSKEYTMKIIDKAQNWLLLYDYGEDNKDNIYYDEEVAEALLAKLRDKDSKFDINIIFKKDEAEVAKLPLVRALKQWQQELPEPNAAGGKVSFIYNIDRSADKYKPFNWYCRVHPYHYKINDLGYAYLTSHSEGQRRRQFVYIGPCAEPSAKDRVSDNLAFHNEVLSSSR